MDSTTFRDVTNALMLWRQKSSIFCFLLSFDF